MIIKNFLVNILIPKSSLSQINLRKYRYESLLTSLCSYRLHHYINRIFELETPHRIVRSIRAVNALVHNLE